MNKIFTLIKYFLKIDFYKYNKNKKKTAFSIIGIFWFVFIMYKILEKSPAYDNTFSIVLTLMLILFVAQQLSYVYNLIIKKEENQKLFILPLKFENVILARIIANIINCYIGSLILFFPMLFLKLYNSNYSIIYYILTLIAMALFVMEIVLIICIIVILFINFIVKNNIIFKYSKRVLYFFYTIFGISYYYIIFKVYTEDGKMGEILDYDKKISLIFFKNWKLKIIFFDNKIELFKYMILSLAFITILWIISLYVLNKFALKIFKKEMYLENRKVNISEDKKYKKKNKIFSYILKEIKLNINNFFLTRVIMPLIVGIILITIQMGNNLEMMISNMNYDFKKLFVNIYFATFLFSGYVAVYSFVSSTFSREKKGIKTTAILPLTINEHIFIRLVSSSFLSFVSVFIFGIYAIIRFNLSYYLIIPVILGDLLSMIFFGLLFIRSDCKNPKFDFENEQELMSAGRIFGNMVYVLILFILYAIFIFINYIICFVVLNILIFSFLIALHKDTKTLVKKLFRNISV